MYVHPGKSDCLVLAHDFSTSDLERWMSKKRLSLLVVVPKGFGNGAAWFSEKTAIQLLGGGKQALSQSGLCSAKDITIGRQRRKAALSSCGQA